MKRRKRFYFLFLATCVFTLSSQPFVVSAQEKAFSRRLFQKGLPNMALPTLGGKQFWGDEFHYADWRIQKNVVTGHYRLLSPTDTRYAWGSYSQCQKKLNEIIEKRGLKPYSGKVVLVLHGLCRTRSSMKKMTSYLKEKSEYTVLNLSYPSTRENVEQYADRLHRIIEGLGPEVTEIHFVAHSLGNIVLRHYLKDRQENPEKVDSPAVMGRVVMLGPPNQGSAMARIFDFSLAFATIAGETGKELGKEWKELQQRLAVPDDFGVIAGGNKKKKGRNPLLKGDDDLVVRVDETKLAGAADFRVEPVIHTYIMDNLHVQQMTLSFLNNGYFTTPDERQPLTAEEITRERTDTDKR
ncbi:MAG: alpha/beta hydrolase [Pirellulaceae bacterium]|nr:alpha/beta hydrolase [Pirellulaceae bacterium]